MVITHGEMLLRMGAAVVLGGAIGFERERHDRPAGLRTHMLVALASATFMLVSTQFIYFQQYGKDDLVMVDTSRIAASVVTGIGFLGAGAILRTGLSIQGLTTAASLWLVAAIGLASGGGMHVEAVTATTVALLGLLLLRRFEGKGARPILRRLAVVLEDGGASRAEVVAQLRDTGAHVAEVGFDHHVGSTKKLLLDLHLADSAALERLLAHLESLPGVRQVRVRWPPLEHYG